jgi:hypothetical protein
MINCKIVTNKTFVSPLPSLIFSPPSTPYTRVDTRLRKRVVFATRHNTICIHPYDYPYQLFTQKVPGAVPAPVPSVLPLPPASCMRTGSKVHDFLPASSNMKHLPPSSPNSSNEFETLATSTTSSFAPVLQESSCTTDELLVLPTITSSLTSSPLVDYFGAAVFANAQD